MSSNVMAYDRPIELYETIWPCPDCDDWHVELVPDFVSADQFDTFMAGTPEPKRRVERASIVLRVWHDEDCPSWKA